MAQDIPNTRIVAPRELVEAAFARGSSPSASARKTIALMLHKAAGGAWEPDKLFSIPMRAPWHPQGQQPAARRARRGAAHLDPH